MSFSPSNCHNLWSPQFSASSPKLSPVLPINVITSPSPASTTQRTEDSKEAIKKMFEKVELSVSAYDTAWLARVPSPASPTEPCFPGCLDWILENQQHDGSWGLPDHDPFLIKDVLSSTLACVLALKTWRLGEEQVRRGLDFVVANFASVMDEMQPSPIGFDIIFPSMIEEATRMNINLHLGLGDVDAVLRRKDLELKRINRKHSKVKDFFLAYVSEGMGKFQDWKAMMKYQRKNGSLFNSPSATAAAFCHHQDSNCHSYLSSVLEQYRNAVPTMYPFEAYFQLNLVDTLEKLGIDRYFKENISSLLNETFRHWEQGHEEIFSDLITCTLAFRLLRDHGYPVSSEPLGIYYEDDGCFDRFGGHVEDIRAAAEIFRASQLVIYPHEFLLEKQVSKSRRFLKQKILNPSTKTDRFTKCITQEVADTLKSPYSANLEHLTRRTHIEHFNLDNLRLLKTLHRCTNSCNEVLLKLATEDYNNCQAIHLQEFKELQRWVTESKLDKLTFSRQKLGYCYFSAAANLFSPELSDARISWAKNGVLTTVVDDFFDVGSSEEEQQNLVELVDKWESDEGVQCCSEKVHIIYSVLGDTVYEIAGKAQGWQGRNVTKHLVEIWLNLVKSMRKEAEISRSKSVPTMSDYLANGYVSFALGPIVLPALYLIGPKLSEQVIRSVDYQNLYELMSTCGRLLNDVQGFQREENEGKLNAVSLHILHSGGAINREDAIEDLKWIADNKRKELLRLVLQGDDNIVPRECRKLFWIMSKVLHLFYMKDDGFTSKDLEATVKAMLYDPLETQITEK